MCDRHQFPLIMHNFKKRKRYATFQILYRIKGYVNDVHGRIDEDRWQAS